MDINELEIVKIDETPPALELRPEEIEAWQTNWWITRQSLPICTTALSRHTGDTSICRD